MKSWCSAHPWMTFLTVLAALGTIGEVAEVSTVGGVLWCVGSFILGAALGAGLLALAAARALEQRR